VGKTSDGFTIVELLIVVVVIAILAAITIVAYNGIANRAKESAVMSSASQAYKKVKSHSILNGDAVPGSLATVGITEGDGSNYQYSTSGTGGFCVTAIKDGRSAFTASNYTYNGGTLLDQGNAKVGACPGHSATGVATIKNMLTSPSFEGSVVSWTPAGTVNLAQSTTWASSGSQSMRIGSTSTGNSGDFRTAGYSPGIIPYGMEPGKTYTVSARLYFTAAPTGGLARAPGVLIWYSTNGTDWAENFGPKPPTTPGVYTVSHTFTLPVNTTGVIVGFGAASTTLSQYFYYDSVMLTEGSTVYAFADGNSPGWVWTGAVNESPSTGPRL